MVYVDQITSVRINADWPWREACHMFCGDEDELHNFARRVGLKRSWFQDLARFPHYDLTSGKRKSALQCGAMAVDREFVVTWMRNRHAPE